MSSSEEEIVTKKKVKKSGKSKSDADEVDRSNFAEVSEKALQALEEAKKIFQKYMDEVDTSKGKVTEEIIKFHMVTKVRSMFNKYVKLYGVRPVARKVKDGEKPNKTRKSAIFFTSVTVTPEAKAKWDKRDTEETDETEEKEEPKEAKPKRKAAQAAEKSKKKKATKKKEEEDEEDEEEDEEEEEEDEEDEEDEEEEEGIHTIDDPIPTTSNVQYPNEFTFQIENHPHVDTTISTTPSYANDETHNVRIPTCTIPRDNNIMIYPSVNGNNYPKPMYLPPLQRPLSIHSGSLDPTPNPSTTSFSDDESTIFEAAELYLSLQKSRRRLHSSNGTVKKRKKVQYYPCSIDRCNKVYTSTNGLKYHEDHGHKNQIPDESKPHVCHFDDCNRRFKSVNGLSYHILNTHKRHRFRIVYSVSDATVAPHPSAVITKSRYQTPSSTVVDSIPTTATTSNEKSHQ